MKTLLITLSIVSCTLATPVHAGLSASGTALPEALNGVAPVGSCKRDDPLATGRGRGAAIASPVLVAADLSCAIGAAELQSMRSRNAAILVDVRHASEYEASHIGGTMNATLAELRTKSYLRDKPLVLVGNGRAERELHSACSTLKAQGFRQVKVLRGGVPAWLAQGNSVAGREPGSDILPHLSTAELWLESQFDANLVLLTRRLTAMQQQLPFAFVVPEASAAAVKAVIERRRKELKNAPLAAVVLAVDPVTTADTLRAIRVAIAPTPVLVYSQPSAVFAREMRQQQASWLAYSRGPKQPPCGL